MRKNVFTTIPFLERMYSQLSLKKWNPELNIPLSSGLDLGQNQLAAENRRQNRLRIVHTWYIITNVNQIQKPMPLSNYQYETPWQTSINRKSIKITRKNIQEFIQKSKIPPHWKNTELSRTLNHCTTEPELSMTPIVTYICNRMLHWTTTCN